MYTMGFTLGFGTKVELGELQSWDLKLKSRKRAPEDLQYSLLP